MVIGRHFTNTDVNYVSMHLDELLVWNEALDPDEIHDLYEVYDGYTNEEIGNISGLEWRGKYLVKLTGSVVPIKLTKLKFKKIDD